MTWQRKQKTEPTFLERNQWSQAIALREVQSVEALPVRREMISYTGKQGQAPGAGAIRADLKSCHEGLRDLSSIVGLGMFQKQDRDGKRPWGPFRFSRMWQWQGNWVFSKWKIFMQWAETAGEAPEKSQGVHHISQIFWLVINFF